MFSLETSVSYLSQTIEKDKRPKEAYANSQQPGMKNFPEAASSLQYN
jgi:hypothetical protein